MNRKIPAKYVLTGLLCLRKILFWRKSAWESIELTYIFGIFYEQLPFSYFLHFLLKPLKRHLLSGRHLTIAQKTISLTEILTFVGIIKEDFSWQMRLFTTKKDTWILFFIMEDFSEPLERQIIVSVLLPKIPTYKAKIWEIEVLRKNKSASHLKEKGLDKIDDLCFLCKILSTLSIVAFSRKPSSKKSLQSIKWTTKLIIRYRNGITNSCVSLEIDTGQ